MKPYDNGGGICMMNTRNYLTKIHTHLQEHDTYKLLTNNPRKAIADDADVLIHYMHSQNITDTATNFYYLPGIHTHTSLLWVIKNTQVKLSSPPYCSMM